MILINADANYRDNVGYVLFPGDSILPGVSHAYNSNSYIHGLIQVTGGSTSVNLGNYVGGSKSLPGCHFSSQGC